MSFKIRSTPNFVLGNKVRFSGTGGRFRSFFQPAPPPPPPRYSEWSAFSPVLWGSQWLVNGITAVVGSGPLRGGKMVAWDMSTTPPTGYKHPDDYELVSDFISGSGQNLYAITRDNSLGYTHFLTRFDKLTHTYSGTLIDSFPAGDYGFPSGSFGGVYSLDCLKTSSTGDIWFVSNTSTSEHLWKFDPITQAVSGTNINIGGLLDGVDPRLSSFLVDQSDVIWGGGYTTTSSPTQPFFLKFVPSTGEVSSTMLPFPNTYGRVQSIVDDPASNKIWATGYVDDIDNGPSYAFWCIDKTSYEVSGTFQTLYTYGSQRITNLWTPDSNNGWSVFDVAGSYENVSYVSTAVLHDGKVWNAFRGERPGNNYGEIDLINIDTSSGVISQKFIDTSAWQVRGPMGNLLVSGSNDLYLCSLAGGKSGSTTKLYKFDTSTDTTTTSTVSDLNIYFYGRKSLDPITGKISLSADMAAYVAIGPSETGGVAAIAYYDPATDTFETRKFTLFTDGSSQEY